MRKLKKLFIIIYVFLALFLVFVVNGAVERVLVNKEVEAFVKRGELVYQKGNTEYYRVSPKYSYEDLTRHIINDYNDTKPGAKGDIFVTPRNPLRGDPFMDLLSEITWLGHAGIVVSDDGKKTIEITGNLGSDNNYVQEWNNTWIIEQHTEEMMLLRIKNTTSLQRDKMVEYAYSQIGKKYNYTFLFNRGKTYYCSDLVSRAIEHAGLNVNYDFVATTGADMLLSDNTYIVYYKKEILVGNNIIRKIYYLGV